MALALNQTPNMVQSIADSFQFRFYTLDSLECIHSTVIPGLLEARGSSPGTFDGPLDSSNPYQGLYMAGRLCLGSSCIVGAETSQAAVGNSSQRFTLER